MSETSSNEEATAAAEQTATAAQDDTAAGAQAETPAVDGPPIKPLDQHAP
jgi:hypothetical protein